MGVVFSQASQLRMKVFIALLALVASAVAFETCGKKGSGSRIVNGLPAAHCFMQSKSPSKFAVRVGEWKQQNNDGTEKDIAVEKIITHAQFNTPHQVEHDIALIKLADSVDFSGPYAGPACMPDATDDYEGATDCWLSGWGLVQPPRTMPNPLQKLKGSIWKDADLKARWPGMIWPGMIGFGTDYSSACMGDSGGPLVCPSKSKPGQYDIVGVVSWGTGTCQGQPGVFTSVTHFHQWIQDHALDHMKEFWNVSFVYSYF